MKLYKYLSGLSVAAVAMMVAACDTDNEGDLYADDPDAVCFMASAMASVSVEATNPTFTVELTRGNAANALSGTVSLKATHVVEVANEETGEIEEVEEDYPGITVSGYTFAPGEYLTTVTVDATALAIGIDATVTLTLDADNVSLGGSNKITFPLSKAYTWVSLGTGTFTDNWGWAITYNVEILKAEGFDRWRVVGPYRESEINDDGQWEDWLAGGSADYIEFWLRTDGIVDFYPFYTGIIYSGTPGAEIWCYPGKAPYDFTAGVTMAYNKFVDEKTVQLAPLYWIDGMGGWNNTVYDGVIVITLP